MCGLDEADPNVVAAEVILLRAAFDKAIMIVEGGSDEKFFRSYIDENKCEIVIAKGRESALSAMAELEGRGLNGIVCIVDRDYDEFLGIVRSQSNVISTDDRDLEVMMIKSRALEKLLAEMASRPKLKMLRDAGEDPRDLLAKAARIIGSLRVHSAKDGLGLKFDGIVYSSVCRQTLSVDEKALITEVLNNSRRSVTELDDIESGFAVWRDADIDQWKICAGHDLSAVLGKALTKILGNQSSQEVKADKIESRLRMAYDADDLRSTDMFRSIRAWEAASAPYRCLRADI